MSLVKWGFVGLLVLPVAEAATFIMVALLIGWLAAMAACLATSAIGLIVLRRAGRAGLDRFLAAFARDGIGAIHLESPGLATLTGGILLVLPGFITDLLGALLFLPAFRRWMRGKIAQARRRPSDPRGRVVIDLPPDQWHQIPDQASERKRRRKRSG
jgi:UPF0716 protein FxsA